MDTFERISQIIQDVLDEDDLAISPNTVMDDAEDWDSLAQIQIVSAIEKEFSIKFSLQEVEQLNTADNVGHIVELVSQKLTG